MNPLDYSLCGQTVTLYGLRQGTPMRKVVEFCHFAPQQEQKSTLTGKSRLKKFLLIIPGNWDVQPGDRVYDGVGPETIAWDSFLPDLVEKVYEIGYATPCCWDGEVCHIQAGLR